jgi:hypothetical protein
MSDTDWILPELKRLLGRHIPNYEVEYVGVNQAKKEITLIKYKPKNPPTN